ncbi:MAG: pyridoxamine 5'-phosphate oxidase family protein [Oscillospiraceae bacterium]|nr:pyridoxamine 5'-phosphate oxidase family protein [Oscillospiraceae bacterium]
MSGIEKVVEFLDKAKTFYFLTTDGDQPRGRPFGFKIVYNGKLYFGCGTFKNVFKQLVANPRVEILAVNGMDFMRYDGKAVVVKDEGLLAAVREANANLMGMYDKNGWEMGLFYLEGGHAEIRGMMELKEEFDV